MRTIPSAFAAHLAGAVTTTCHAWRVVRRDGAVLGFTDHDRDLVVAGTLCLARSGLEGAEMDATLGLAVGGGDVAGALTADAITEDDLSNGLYDGARVEVWLVNWADVTQSLLLDVATIGEVHRSEHAFTAELRGLAHALDQDRGGLYQASCSADLGDARCKVAIDGAAYRATRSVLASDGTTLTLDLAAYADGWFIGGTLAFTSGANAGARTTIKAQRGDRVSLWTSPARAVGAGDTVTITAGCDKLFATCQAKFDNVANFRGFPHMPGNDVVLAYANAGDTVMDGGSLFR